MVKILSFSSHSINQFCATHDQQFPSESVERAAYWVGYVEHCDDAITHKLLDNETQKISIRGAGRGQKSSTPNHRLAQHGGFLINWLF